MNDTNSPGYISLDLLHFALNTHANKRPNQILLADLVDFAILKKSPSELNFWLIDTLPLTKSVSTIIKPALKSLCGAGKFQQWQDTLLYLKKCSPELFNKLIKVQHKNLTWTDAWLGDSNNSHYVSAAQHKWPNQTHPLTAEQLIWLSLNVPLPVIRNTRSFINDDGFSLKTISETLLKHNHLQEFQVIVDTWLIPTLNISDVSSFLDAANSDDVQFFTSRRRRTEELLDIFIELFIPNMSPSATNAALDLIIKVIPLHALILPPADTLTNPAAELVNSCFFKIICALHQNNIDYNPWIQRLERETHHNPSFELFFTKTISILNGNLTVPSYMHLPDGLLQHWQKSQLTSKFSITGLSTTTKHAL